MAKKIACMALLIVALAAPASAQVGIGGRISAVRSDVDSETGAERFVGGHIRALLSPRMGIEVALERRTDTISDTERIRQYPLQASLLLFPVRGSLAPYLLGGGGWYTTRVELLDGDETISSESTRRFGWHGGFGAELRMGRHAALHADYRFTNLRFSDDDEEEEESGLSRFLPSHDGSMWTAGLTIYF